MMDKEEGKKFVKEHIVKHSQCLGCKYFVSFEEDYFDDEEPDWCGFCKHPENENDAAGTGEGCSKKEVLK